MISPEQLRKYEFFGFLDTENLDKVAMLAESVSWAAGDLIVKADGEADSVYLLTSGGVDLGYFVEDTLVSDKSKEFFVGSINPGEPFGLSGLLEPYKYTANCVATLDSEGIKVDAKKLLAAADADPALGYSMMKAVAKGLFERLGTVRAELVAAR